MNEERAGSPPRLISSEYDLSCQCGSKCIIEATVCQLIHAAASTQRKVSCVASPAAANVKGVSSNGLA